MDVVGKAMQEQRSGVPSDSAPTRNTLEAVQREHGQQAVDQFIDEFKPDELFDFNKGTNFIRTY